MKKLNIPIEKELKKNYIIKNFCLPVTPHLETFYNHLLKKASVFLSDYGLDKHVDFLELASNQVIIRCWIKLGSSDWFFSFSENSSNPDDPLLRHKNASKFGNVFSSLEDIRKMSNSKKYVVDQYLNYFKGA